MENGEETSPQQMPESMFKNYVDVKVKVCKDNEENEESEISLFFPPKATIKDLKDSLVRTQGTDILEP